MRDTQKTILNSQMFASSVSLLCSLCLCGEYQRPMERCMARTRFTFGQACLCNRYGNGIRKSIPVAHGTTRNISIVITIAAAMSSSRPLRAIALTRMSPVA